MSRQIFIHTMMRCASIAALFLVLLGGFSAHAGTVIEGDVVIDIVGSDGETTMNDQLVIPG